MLGVRWWRLLPEVVPPAQDEVGFGVERGAHLAQAAVAAGTLEAVLVPVLVQGLQQVAVLDLPVAAGTAFWLRVRLDGEHLYTYNNEKRVKTMRKKEFNSNQWHSMKCAPSTQNATSGACGHIFTFYSYFHSFFERSSKAMELTLRPLICKHSI